MHYAYQKHHLLIANPGTIEVFINTNIMLYMRFGYDYPKELIKNLTKHLKTSAIQSSEDLLHATSS